MTRANVENSPWALLAKWLGIAKRSKAKTRRVTGWSVRFEHEADLAGAGAVVVRNFKSKRAALLASATEPGGGADPVACYGKRGAA